jgi:hypothetical protein
MKSLFNLNKVPLTQEVDLDDSVAQSSILDELFIHQDGVVNNGPT